MRSSTNPNDQSIYRANDAVGPLDMNELNIAIGSILFRRAANCTLLF